MSLDNNIRFALFLAAIFATALPIPEPAPVIRIFLLESSLQKCFEKEHVS